jgi:hypothetical protein
VLSVESFLAPPLGRGHFPPEYFPGAQDGGKAATTARLREGTALAASIAEADRDTAVLHFVNWKTAYGLYVSLLGTPANVTAPNGAVSIGWTQDQRDKLLAYWQEEQAAWEDALSVGVTPAPEPDQFPSGAVPKDIEWN